MKSKLDYLSCVISILSIHHDANCFAFTLQGSLITQMSSLKIIKKSHLKCFLEATRRHLAD